MLKFHRAGADPSASNWGASRPWPRPLVWRLMVLCAAVTVPLFIFSALLLLQYAQGERRRLEYAGEAAVREIAAALERDLVSLTSVLETLSLSTRLAEGDMAGFHRLASSAARSTGLPVVLSDLTGQQIVNTRLPFGAELPRVAISYERVIQTRQPQVTDLFMGAVAQAPIFALSAPVLSPETGAVTHVLNFSIDPARIRDVLLAAGLADRAFAGVIDRNGRMMARTVDHERLLGSAPKPFLNAVAGRREGQERLVNRDGVEILASFTRMKTTGWIVAHGFPVDVIDEPLRRLVWQLVEVALLTGLITGLGGFVLSRRIVGALSSLEASASAVGHGAVVAPVHTSVSEINQVSERIALASQELRQITDAKDALLYEVNHRVKNSLAVVTSLLALQARQTADESLKRGLDDLRARIDVVASVHQRLYQTGLHDRLDVGPFLSEIASGMVQALCGEGCALRVDCEEGIILRVDRITPLALIVGELLTNAVKHGSAGGSACGISLTVRREPDNRVRVIVADQGQGLPADFSTNTGEGAGVGMRIVAGLLRQIRARMETNAGARGARFEIVLDEVNE